LTADLLRPARCRPLSLTLVYGGMAMPRLTAEPCGVRMLADFRRRLKVGSRMLCVHNEYRPVLDGLVREVVKVQTNSFAWVGGDPKLEPGRKSWTDIPKARDFRVIDADTVEWRLFPGHPEKPHTLRLRFLAEDGATP
jgi:hypothetical protein